MADESMHEDPKGADPRDGDTQGGDAESGGTESSGTGGGLGLLLGVFLGGVIFDSVTFALLFGMAGLIIGGSARKGGTS